MAAYVVLLIAVAILSFWGGTVGGSTTETIASTTTTVVSVTTITNSTTSSFTMTSIVVQTFTTYQTIVQKGPPIITISGRVSTKIPGTSPSQLNFISASKNTTFSAKATNGEYSLTLPNEDFYNIYIEYNSIIPGNVGAGRCTAGAMAVFILGDNMNATWSC